MTYKLICNQQQDWARQRGIKFDKDGYTLSLNDNLFSSLLPQVKKKFQSGKGDELGSEGKRGKMQALHSSSALVVNESYHRHTKRTIKDKYLNVPGLWARLPRCEKLVKHIREEEQARTSFAYLDVPQLLKHILGLSCVFGPTGFELLYLWYEVPSEEAKNHREELEKLKGYIGDEVTFRDMTYRELFAAIRECHAVGGGYISYLAERYFPHLID